MRRMSTRDPLRPHSFRCGVYRSASRRAASAGRKRRLFEGARLIAGDDARPSKTPRSWCRTYWRVLRLVSSWRRVNWRLLDPLSQ